jgi:hypothetical protein
MNHKLLFSLALVTQIFTSSFASSSSISDLVEAFRAKADQACPASKENSPREIRDAYNCQVSMLSELKSAIVEAPEFQDPVSNTTKAEAEMILAQTLHAQRRDIGEVFKKVTPWVMRQIIYLRNNIKYGNSYGPTFDSLIKRGKTFAEITNSSMRTGGEDLGLTSPTVLNILNRIDSVLEGIGII